MHHLTVSSEAEQPEGETEKLKERELQLQDLEPEVAAPRIELHLHRNNDSGFSNSDTHTANGNDLSAAKVLENVNNSLPHGPVNKLLTSTIPPASTISEAQSQVFGLIDDRRHTEQAKDITIDAETPSSDAAAIREMKLSHATAVEFLHHFWAAFLSCDAARAAGLAQLAASVEKSRVRLLAIVDRYAEAGNGVGEKEVARVRGYIGVTLKSIEKACRTYKEILKKQQEQQSSGAL